MKLTFPLPGRGPVPAAKPAGIAFGAAMPADQPARPSKDLLVIRQPSTDFPAGETCDWRLARSKSLFEQTLENYSLKLSDPDQVMFAACMNELLFACTLQPEERQHRISTVKTLLRTLDDAFLQSPWFEPFRFFGKPEREPFTMGDMALNLMVVYGTPEDVAYCLEDRKISPLAFSPVGFHGEYPTPLHRAINARKPQNIAVLLKYLKPEHLRAANQYGEDGLSYAFFHRSDAETLHMLDEAYRKAGL